MEQAAALKHIGTIAAEEVKHLTAGHFSNKLDSVVSYAGELIVFAPHINEISLTHGEVIHQIGCRCRDYFQKQWEKYKDVPWGVLAHSTHVCGIVLSKMASNSVGSRLRLLLESRNRSAEVLISDIAIRERSSPKS